MTAERSAGHGRRRLLAVGFAVGATLTLSACSSVPDWANPTAWYRDVAGENAPPPTATVIPPASETAAKPSYPNVGPVPPRPTPPSTAAQKQLEQGLVAEGAKARYTAQTLTGTPPNPPSGPAAKPLPPEPAPPGSVVTAPPSTAEPSTAEKSRALPQFVPGSSPSGALPPMPSRIPQTVAQTSAPKAPQPPAQPQSPRQAMAQTQAPAPPAPLPPRTVAPSEQGLSAQGPAPRPPAAQPPVGPVPAGATGSATGLMGTYMAALQASGANRVPGTRESAGAAPSGGRAPRRAPEPAFAEAGIHRVATLYFAAGSARIAAKDYVTLRHIAAESRNLGAVIRVVGHASPGGGSASAATRKLANFDISFRRAQVVGQALIRAGAAPGNVEIVAASDNSAPFGGAATGAVARPRVEIFLEN